MRNSITFKHILVQFFVKGKIVESMIGRNCTAFLLLFILMACTACDSNNDKVKKIACIGDSITYGHGIENREHNSYPAQLEQLLGDGFDVENFGVSGATMLKKGDLPYWNQKECDSAFAYNPDVVIIMLGSNDSKPWNWDKKKEYQGDYISLINKFQALESQPEIWICNPPPAFQERWGINDSIISEDIIPSISKIALIENVKVIDMYQPFIDKDTCFPDFIHPDSTGAALIASTVVNTVIHNKNEQ